jgi:rhomboid protease GluP
MGFLTIVLGGCGLLYLVSLVLTVQLEPESSRGGGLSMLSPSTAALFLLGASGSQPVFRYGRWWTVLSAAWLHGGLLHILFNMMSARNLIPGMAHLYGAGRTVIIYCVSAVTGFLASSIAGAYFPYIPFLHGAGFTIGASASIFGLIGALVHYGSRASSRIREQAVGWALSGVVFAFLMPGIDNWAHLGGFAGGWLLSRWMDPLTPERGDHVLGAVICLALSLASVVASVLFGLKFVR